MKVVLFSGFWGGHHPKYAEMIAKRLVAQGHEAIYIVRVHAGDNFHKDFQLSSVFSQVIKLEQEKCKKGPTSLGPLLFEGLKIAKQLKADVFHWLYADEVLPLLYAKIRGGTQGISVAISLFWFTDLVNHEYWLWSLLRPVRLIRLIKLFKKISNPLLIPLFFNSVNHVFVHNLMPTLIVDKVKSTFKLSNKNLHKVNFLPDPNYDEHFVDGLDKVISRDKLGLPQQERIILFFGAFNYDKGIQTLLDASLKLKKRVVIVIAGQSCSFPSSIIEEYKNRLDLTHENDKPCIITKFGYVKEEDAPLYFNAADAVIMPYLENYGLGLSGVFLQSCEARRKVICSDVGILGGTVRVLGNGYLFEVGSAEDLSVAIEQFLQDSILLNPEVEQKVAHYATSASPVKIAEQIIEAYGH